jgi:hypothetical protein
MQWAAMGPLMAPLAGNRHHLDWDPAARLDGTRHRRKRPPPRRCAAASMGPAALRLWDPTPQVKARLALASLVLGSRGPLVASLNSVAAVLRFRSGDHRLISRDAKPKAEPSAAERNVSRPTGR